MEMAGLAVEIPTERVLAKSKIEAEFFRGTRFSKIMSQAENIPQAAATDRKFAI